MNRPSIYILLILLFAADLAFSFGQHMNQPLDGDLPWILAPSDDLIPVLENPFGLQTILADSTYLNPNRYFSHAALRTYMGSAPIALQVVADPISSVYLAAAIAKTIIQCLLILILAGIINGGLHLRKTRFWGIVLLVTPFFQANGYQAYMGVIAPSITYTFFYALPFLALLIYFLPIYYTFYSEKSSSLHPIKTIAHFLLLPLVCLSGPLNPGIALVLSLVVFIAYVSRGINTQPKISLLSNLKDVPKQIYVYLIPLVLFSLFSLVIGRYDSFSQASEISIASVYSNLPNGLWKMVSTKIGLPLLVGAIITNALVIRFTFPKNVSRLIRKSMFWVGVFVLLYILLLPLGGYRAYRPDTFRYDTFLPVTISLIYLFAASCIFLLDRLQGQMRRVYMSMVIVVLMIFTLADRGEFENNDCEQAAFRTIASSSLDIVELGNECSVMDWRLFHNPKHSLLRSRALVSWGIIDEEKLYYNKP
jgi:hypothetical protein